MATGYYEGPQTGRMTVTPGKRTTLGPNPVSYDEPGRTATWGYHVNPLTGQTQLGAVNPYYGQVGGYRHFSFDANDPYIWATGVTGMPGTETRTTDNTKPAPTRYLSQPNVNYQTSLMGYVDPSLAQYGNIFGTQGSNFQGNISPSGGLLATTPNMFGYVPHVQATFDPNYSAKTPRG